MLSLALVPALAFQASPSARAWEKPIAPGVTYRMEVDPSGPFVSHALLVSPGAPGVRLAPALPGNTVYGPAPLYGRGTVTQMADEAGAIAAINTDFFPLGRDRGTGDPLGGMVMNGELVSVPGRRRATFAWGPAGFQAGFLDWTGSISFGKGSALPLQGLNEETGLNRIVLDTERAGVVMSKTPCTLVTVALDTAGPLRPNVPRTGKIVALETDLTEKVVPPGQVVIVAQGAKAALLGNPGLGDPVKFVYNLPGFDATKVVNVVGGGPFLLKDGQTAIDGGDEGFSETDFVQKRHGRSAMGRTADGRVVIFAVDGRSTTSVGMSLPELAAKMARLGCVEAINLDGGGSTAISLFGAALNRPSDGRERPVAAGLVLFADVPKENGTPALVFRHAATGYVASLRLGRDPVPNAEIVWSAVGDATIDQGGAVTPLKNGTVTLRAVWRGRVVANAYPVKTSKPAAGGFLPED